jgi:hypothetical protein
MSLVDGIKRVVRTPQARVGLALLLLGEILILIRLRPVSDFYFPFVWLGYILVLDGSLLAHAGRSLFSHHWRLFLLMFPLSGAFWWIFELLNASVGNWVYIGAGRYTGVWYVLIASMDFSTVLPAVWESALLLQALLPHTPAPTTTRQLPRPLAVAMIVTGIACIVLPSAFPRYAFGLIWGSLFFLLDPINAALGGPSLARAALRRDFRTPLCFAFGALLCGFFWEGWNYWSMPKWIYHVPYVNFFHVFEMPLLGFGGYLPFGLELFAMTNFALFLLRQTPVTLESVVGRGEDASHVPSRRSDRVG